MRVYDEEAGYRRLVGFAAVTEGDRLLLEVNVLFAPNSVEQFKIGCIALENANRLERVIFVGLGQAPDRLPGWRQMRVVS